MFMEIIVKPVSKTIGLKLLFFHNEVGNNIYSFLSPLVQFILGPVSGCHYFQDI